MYRMEFSCRNKSFFVCRQIAGHDSSTCCKPYFDFKYECLKGTIYAIQWFSEKLDGTAEIWIECQTFIFHCYFSSVPVAKTE